MFLETAIFILFNFSCIGFVLMWLNSCIYIYSFLVDGIPIREFKNLESYGIPYPKYQPMRLYSSLWNADNWATRGGLVKIDWTQAPFTASYRNFNADSNSDGTWYWKKVDYAGKGQIQWVQKNYMIYNYCTDAKRFPLGFAPECYLANVF